MSQFLQAEQQEWAAASPGGRAAGLLQDGIQRLGGALHGYAVAAQLLLHTLQNKYLNRYSISKAFPTIKGPGPFGRGRRPVGGQELPRRDGNR